jgi:FHA domain-containing protein
MTTVRCRQGHESETPDFCDECGAPIDGAPVSSGASAAARSSSGGSAAPARPAPAPPATYPGEVCPRCGTPRTGRFCEEDGHDFVVSGSTPAPAPDPNAAAASSPTPSSGAVPGGASSNGDGWVVTVEADRRYYESMVAREGPDIAAVTFPNYYPRAEVPLVGEEVRVGRRRVRGSGTPPHVDLAGPPLDPGVSHLHAVLLPLPDDDGWSVLDPGSTNGTTINYGDEPIARDTVVPLRAGDRVHVGAFTTLVLARR